MIAAGLTWFGVPGVILLVITAPIVGLDLDELGPGLFGAGILISIYWPLCIPIAFGIARKIPYDSDGAQGRRLLVFIGILCVASIAPALFFKVLSLTY